MADKYRGELCIDAKGNTLYLGKSILIHSWKDGCMVIVDNDVHYEDRETSIFSESYWQSIDDPNKSYQFVEDVEKLLFNYLKKIDSFSCLPDRLEIPMSEVKDLVNYYDSLKSKQNFDVNKKLVTFLEGRYRYSDGKDYTDPTKPNMYWVDI